LIWVIESKNKKFTKNGNGNGNRERSRNDWVWLREITREEKVGERGSEGNEWLSDEESPPCERDLLGSVSSQAGFIYPLLLSSK
jgi:hypothetical protein